METQGIHSRGYLPHIEGADYQFITYRLADSLPQAVLKKMSSEPNNQAKRRMMIDEYLDRGEGSCVLANADIASMTLSCWRHFHQLRYNLIAYVIMPNHVHVLVQIFKGESLSKIVHSWKSFSSKQAQKILSKPMIPFWQKEYWDRYIRDEQHFAQVIDYIHENPVKAGLVDKTEQWPWSSAYAGETPALPAFEFREPV